MILNRVLKQILRFLCSLFCSENTYIPESRNAQSPSAGGMTGGGNRTLWVDHRAQQARTATVREPPRTL